MRKTILTIEEIKKINQDLGKKFTELFKDEELSPVFIGVMKGALPFMMDLIREIDCPILTDYVQISSYMGTESTGVIKLKKDVSINLENRQVVIVEDIIDSGNTLKWLKEYLQKNYCPKKIITCTLLDKKCQRKVDFDSDYVGKVIGNEFIVGYGLDYDEYFRNEKYVFVPSKEEIEAIDKKNNF